MNIFWGARVALPASTFFLLLSSLVRRGHRTSVTHSLPTDPSLRGTRAWGRSRVQPSASRGRATAAAAASRAAPARRRRARPRATAAQRVPSHGQPLEEVPPGRGVQPVPRHPLAVVAVELEDQLVDAHVKT